MPSVDKEFQKNSFYIKGSKTNTYNYAPYIRCFHVKNIVLSTTDSGSFSRTNNVDIKRILIKLIAVGTFQ